MYVCPNKITDLEQCHCASDGADTVRVNAFVCVALLYLPSDKGKGKTKVSWGLSLDKVILIRSSLRYEKSIEDAGA